MNWQTMSFSEALFHVIALIAIVGWIVRLARVNGRVRRHRRMATPHHSTRRNSTQAISQRT